ncbi:hypothetical protein D3C80_1494660 [compost metagenome]
MQGLRHQRAVQLPVPALFPRQRLGQVRGQLWLSLKFVDQRLLLRLQHLHQQAALNAPALQGLQQPQLQCVVVGVVVLLPYQHTRRIGQPRDQLFWADELPAGQVFDLPQLRMLAPFSTLPARQRRQAGLASAQRQHQAQRKTGQQWMAHR